MPGTAIHTAVHVHWYGAETWSKVCSTCVQVVTDFFDELKSRSKGYASMEYTVTGYRKNDLVRLDIKINNEVQEHLLTFLLSPPVMRLMRAQPCQPRKCGCTRAPPCALATADSIATQHCASNVGSYMPTCVDDFLCAAAHGCSFRRPPNVLTKCR